MPSAGRSLTEPPGLNHSALAANSMAGNSRPTRSSRSKGVLPINSRTERPAELCCEDVPKASEYRVAKVVMSLPQFWTAQVAVRGCPLVSADCKGVHVL